MAIAHDEIGRHAIAGDYLPAVVVPAPEAPLFPNRVYSIDLCRAWVKIAEAPAATFDGVLRDLLSGEWRLSGAVSAVDFQSPFTLTDVDTIRVVEDNRIVFSGYLAPMAASGVGGLEIVHGADGEQFTLTGPDPWSVLNSRVCYPSPLTGPPWAASWDVRTGLASTCAAGYVTANLGGGTSADRQYPGLTVIDRAAGATGTWSARLQKLDQQVARVCRDGGITCRLAVDFLGGLTATLGSPNDRRGSVVVSDQGGLTNIKRVRVPAAATFVIGGGQGNLTARTFATAGTATGAARREAFSDQSSLSTVTEVGQSAATTLAQDGSTLTVTAEITDAGAAGIRYLIDYDIGDTISAEVGDVRYPVVVAAVTIHVATDRQVIRPILGAAAPDLVTGLINDVAGLASRFDSQIS